MRRDGKGLDEFLRETDTLAFVLVHRDRVVRERYFGGATRASMLTSFSVAKSFVSTLVGIAIDEGLIGSVEDRITELHLGSESNSGLRADAQWRRPR